MSGRGDASPAGDPPGRPYHTRRGTGPARRSSGGGGTPRPRRSSTAEDAETAEGPPRPKWAGTAMPCPYRPVPHRPAPQAVRRTIPVAQAFQPVPAAQIPCPGEAMPRPRATHRVAPTIHGAGRDLPAEAPAEAGPLGRGVLLPQRTRRRRRARRGRAGQARGPAPTARCLTARCHRLSGAPYRWHRLSSLCPRHKSHVRARRCLHRGRPTGSPLPHTARDGDASPTVNVVNSQVPEEVTK